MTSRADLDLIDRNADGSLPQPTFRMSHPLASGILNTRVAKPTQTRRDAFAADCPCCFGAGCDACE